MQQNKFITTATFCYVCHHVQINGMGYDAVYAQTKENHYVDPSTNSFFQTPDTGIVSFNSRDSWLPVSGPDPEMFGFSGKSIGEKELEKMILYPQGNTRKFPMEEFNKKYGSPGDGEYKIEELKEE